MGFEALLGNERLKQNLTAAIDRGRVSHFYLISGPAGSGKKTLARLLAAALVCSAEKKPCGCCNPCRKVMSDNHPDFITIDDPEKKYVPVELVRDARADIYIYPNEADRKIYLFPRAQDMLPPSQNALLKILEEPPAYGVFLLLTDNPQKMLPTVRSRCTELALTGLQPEQMKQALQQACPQATQEQLQAAIGRSGGYLGQAIALLNESEDTSQTAMRFLQAYAARDTLALLQVLAPMEKWKRDALIEELEHWLTALGAALSARNGVASVQPMTEAVCAARSAKELLEAISALKKSIDYASRNISVGAVCGYLQWALR